MEYPHSKQFQQAQAAVAEVIRDKRDARLVGVSQQAPACTLRTACAICGSVHGKPWANRAKELCRHGCYWILAGHIAWNGSRQRVKFFTAEAVPLMASYKTYDKLMAEGAKLDARPVQAVEPEVKTVTV